MKELLKRLNIDIKSEFLEEAYQKAINSPEKVDWLEEDYILKLNEKMGVLPTHLKDVLEALKQIADNSDLKMLAKILYYIIELSPDRARCFEKIELPLRKENGKDALGYNLVGEFPLLAHVRKTYEAMKKRGIDESDLKNTFVYFDRAIDSSFDRMKFLCLNATYFSWGLLYVYGELLRIERFEFEIERNIAHSVRIFENNKGEFKVLADNVKIHRSGFILGAAGCENEEAAYDADFKETDEYYEGYAVNTGTHLFENKRTRLNKKEWKLVLKKGDAAVGIHIPANLPLNDEICAVSFKRAREVMRKCYPEIDFKIFETSTWLLAAELKAMLKPDSNILAFQRKFYIYPYEHAWGKAVFSFVYHMDVAEDLKVNYENLSEDTSLMRNIKKHYKDGKYIHEFSGFFKF